MKLVLKNVDSFVKKRLTILKKEIPCLDSAWHYHPEYELLYISKSYGIRYVGDSVAPFAPGNLVLVGPYLPHLWRNDVSYYQQDGTKKIETIVIKFSKNFIGEGTFNNPEFSAINQMLKQSKFGILFDKMISEKLHKGLMKLPGLSSIEQSIKLLDILHRLSLSMDQKVLSSTDMRQSTTEHSHRLDKVIKYISDNYADTICLNDVADIACMTTNSFCRFFKKKMHKSYTQFLNEVRIRNASRLLAQDNLPISEVCYRVGYNSITNFNKRFKEIMGSTPKNYRYTLSATNAHLA